MDKSKGFTIIELIIVIAIFLFIIGAAIGIFVSVVSNQRKILAENQLISQISYVQEYMSKALRMAKTEENEGCNDSGYIYSLTKYYSELVQYRGIKFVNGNSGSCQEFYWDYINKALCEDKSGSCSNLTSTNLQINSIKFRIEGGNNDSPCEGGFMCRARKIDPDQPRVTILLKVFTPWNNVSNGIVCSQNSDCPSWQGCSNNMCQPTRTFQITTSSRNLNVKY